MERKKERMEDEKKERKGGGRERRGFNVSGLLPASRPQALLPLKTVLAPSPGLCLCFHPEFCFVLCLFVCSETCGLVSSLNRSQTKETMLPEGGEIYGAINKPGTF